jgi:hypothetical protein
MGLGVALAPPRRRAQPAYASNENGVEKVDDDWIRLTGAGLMEVNQGVGVQLSGALW